MRISTFRPKMRVIVLELQNGATKHYLYTGLVGAEARGTAFVFNDLSEAEDFINRIDLEGSIESSAGWFWFHSSVPTT